MIVFPCTLLSGVERRKGFHGRGGLNVADEACQELASGIGCVCESRSETYAVDVVVGKRGNADVPDVVPAVLVFQHDVPDVNVAYDVLSADSGEIRLRAEAYARDPPLVDIERIQVGISQIGVELVNRVPGLRGECEYSLEQEIKVRVAADDSSVEGVAAELAGRNNSGVVVVIHVQPVHEE